ncbi:DUF3310 domain-containing protein [Streptomyces sp. NPDC056210]|uniref:DUF3310 domain-containing protein n=1 Tax=Streptomyces sp. NPDC056210 TaxID=3345746 RepID=UPI0035D697C3
MLKVRDGFSVGDWVKISMDVEGTPHVGRYAGEIGCITRITGWLINPFEVKFSDGIEWSFSAGELKLDESYLSPEPPVDTRTEVYDDYYNTFTYAGVDEMMDWFWNLEAEAEEPLAEWEKELLEDSDAVNHPSHYSEGWSNGAEVIDITENLIGNRANVVKYVARAGKKGGSEKELEDLRKAQWYINREIERLTK